MGAGLSVALVWARKFGGDLELLDRSGHDACSNSSSAENGCKTEDSYSNSNSSGVVAKFLIPRDIDIESDVTYDACNVRGNFPSTYSTRVLLLLYYY